MKKRHFFISKKKHAEFLTCINFFFDASIKIEAMFKPAPQSTSVNYSGYELESVKHTAFCLEVSARRTVKQVFHEKMNQVTPWRDLPNPIALGAPVAERMHRPIASAMNYCPQQGFGLLDLGAQEALVESSFNSDLPDTSGAQRIPDGVSVLRIRHQVEVHELNTQVLQVVNAKLAAHGLLPNQCASHGGACVSGHQAQIRPRRGSLLQSYSQDGFS